MTADQVQRLLDKIERLLAGSNGSTPRLRVSRELSRVEDDWLYAIVTGAAPGAGAAEYSKRLSEIEQTIRDEDHANVLLVPGAQED